MNLYSEQLLALSRDATHRAPLVDAPTHFARATNPLCGDDVDLSLVVRRGHVDAVSFGSRACSICQASAALMSRLVVGAPVSRLTGLRAALEHTLTHADQADPRFAPFSTVSAFPSRRACALLPWRALEDALIDDGARARPAEPTPPLARATLPLTAWDAALEGLARGHEVALATLVSIVGSSPCPLGSRMVVSSDGSFWGAVSGGCVESAVVHSALELLARPPDSARAEVFGYQISNSQAGAVGLPCGGRIRVHVAPCPPAETIRAYVAATEAGGARLLNLDDGSAELLLSRDDAPASLREHVARALDGDAPVEATGSSGEALFIEPLQRPPRLLFVGGTQVAQKLCALAVEVGYEPVLIDPRLALANPDRFPGVTLHTRHPADALPELIGARDAVVMLTHDEKLDDPGLVVALASEAFYVGALGSRKTQRARLERLRAAGVPEHQLRRLRGPAGLSIGAKGPAEIALSILAEIVQTHRADLVDPLIGALVVARTGDPDSAPFVAACEAAGLTVLLTTSAQDALADGVQRVTSPANTPTSALLREGVAALLERAPLDAIVVLHASASRPSVDALRALRGAYSASTQHLVITLEGLGAPILWPRRTFTDLLGLSGPQTERTLLDAAPGALMRLGALD